MPAMPGGSSAGQQAEPEEEGSMGYFDSIVSSSFKETEDGRCVFYPWGFLGRGLEVPTEGHRQKLHRLLKSCTIAAVVVVVGLVASVSLAIARGSIEPTGLDIYGPTVLGRPGPWMPLLAAPVLQLFVWIRIRALTRGFAVSTEKPNLAEIDETRARSHSYRTLWLAEAGAILLLGTSILLLVFGPEDPLQRAVYLVGFAYFGYAVLVFTKWIRLKKRGSSESGGGEAGGGTREQNG